MSTIFELTFYLFIFAIVLYERFSYLNPLKIILADSAFESLTSDEIMHHPNKITIVITKLFDTLYSVWIIIGLFTFQWYIFLPFIIFSIVSNKETETAIKHDALISIGVMWVILLNKIYFQLEFGDILGWFW